MNLKLLKFEDSGENKIISLIFPDQTYATVSVADTTRDKNNLIKDAYILMKNMNREMYEGDMSLLPDVALNESKPTTFKPNFFELNGEVYDQYGDRIEKEINFEIEGTEKARIENNNIIEEEVDEPTSYFIVAKCGDLTQKEERYIYPEVKHQTTTEFEERLSATEHAMADLMLMMGGMQ